MRTIDELGISPAPWDYQPNNPQGITVADRNNWTVGCFPKETDARLIAAAPMLYEALRETIVALQNRLPKEPTYNEAELVISAYRALAAASGESEVEK